MFCVYCKLSEMGEAGWNHLQVDKAMFRYPHQHSRLSTFEADIWLAFSSS